MSHHPDYTPERRAHVLDYIGHDARVTAVIGALICDRTGHIAAAAVPSALIDPWLRDLAVALLTEAGHDR